MGFDLSCVIKLHLGLVRPKTEYAVSLLSEISIKHSFKLCRTQQKCIRLALAAMNSIHTLSLEQRAIVMPLLEKFRFLANVASKQNLGKWESSGFTFYLRPSDIHNLFIICFGSHNFQPVIKFLLARKSIKAQCCCLNLEIGHIFHRYW